MCRIPGDHTLRNSSRFWLAFATSALALFLTIGVVVVVPGVAHAESTATVDDAVTAGTNKFVYTGSSWQNCGGCNGSAYQGAYHYGYTTGDKVVFTFSGTQATLYGFKEPPGGIGSFAVDGGAAVDVDFYAATQSLSAVFTTPVLVSGTHTVTLTVTGRRASGVSPTVNVDKADVSGGSGTTTTPTTPTTTSTTTTPTTTTTTPTTTTATTPTAPTTTTPPVGGPGTVTVDDAVTAGTNKFVYTGSSWQNCGGCNGSAYQGAYHYGYTTGDKVVFTFSGTQATLYGFKEPPGGIGSFAVDGGAAVDVDFYAATQSLSAVFTTPVLVSGTHTVTLTVTGRRASGVSPTVNVDKADVSGGSGTTTTPTTPTTTSTTTTPTTTTTTPTTTTATTPTAPTTTTPPVGGPGTVTVDDAVTAGTNKFVYTGSSWQNCGGCNGSAYQGAYHYGYTTGDKVVFTFSGTQATLYGFKEPPGGIGSFAVDGGAAVDVDFYAATQSLSAVFTTPVLVSGTHTVTLTVTGRRASGVSPTVNVDKADVSGGSGTTTTHARPRRQARRRQARRRRARRHEHDANEHDADEHEPNDHDHNTNE